ncbi:hypothetical protein BD410DRAFT_182733 [Rickenella mellea]|uniref:Uncharacterized protein n=1 Tax=Rickenella mellea TaxID=50990 RepID=A0A4Y7Q5H6_9AGAM|nr:hypothetical protein BD410DRAFT_182733 [Rickenella mellea]
MQAISESPCHSTILECDEPDSAVTECPGEVFSQQDDSNLEAHLRWSDGAHVPHVSGPGPLPGPSNSTDGSGSRPMYFTPDELESDDVPSEALRIPLPPGTGSTIDGHRDGTNSTPHIPLQHSELPPSTPTPTTPRPMTPRTFTTNRDSHPRTPSDMTVTDFSDTGVSDMGHSVLSEEVGADGDSHDDGDGDGSSSIADGREEGASLLKPHLPSLRISPFELEFDDDASAIRG